jgi:hypothetical protein
MGKKKLINCPLVCVDEHTVSRLKKPPKTPHKLFYYSLVHGRTIKENSPSIQECNSDVPWI